MVSPAVAYVALGSNVGPREALLDRAVALMEREPRVRVRARSRWVETAPMGQGQPGFLNGVVRIETELPPEVLLAWLARVERALGRAPLAPRWGPRVIDLDLLAYDRRRIRRPGLEIPHPGIGRAFLAAPLAEVWAEDAPPGMV